MRQKRAPTRETKKVTKAMSRLPWLWGSVRVAPEHGAVGPVGTESGVDAARVGSGCVHGRPKKNPPKKQ